MRTSPRISRSAEPTPKHVPAGAVSVERGAYLANGPAYCYGCHTELELPSLAFTGQRFSGMPMAEPDPTDAAFEFVMPNLTPDPDTGVISAWSEDTFVARFKQVGRLYAGSKMPWENVAKMTEDDLRSVYRYHQYERIYRSSDGLSWTELPASAHPHSHPITHLITAELRASSVCPGR